MSSVDPETPFPAREEVDLPPDSPPVLLVVVDTEEEFDWNAPFDRSNTSVASMAGIGRLQELCDAHGVRPTYVVTHPIATQPAAVRDLGRYHAEGRAQIGVHQHPWVCPPFEEEVNAFHSYPGNLPAALERAKLEVLTQAIEGAFGAPPTMYKAGRYGFGPHTSGILADLGYLIDLSPCGPFDLSADGGPDYSRMPCRPFRFGADMLCLPATAGFVGRLPEWAAREVYGFAGKPRLSWSRLPGILARSRLVERIRLSPEGYTLTELRRLTRQLLARGERVFSLTLHSPSLVPGNTLYVRDRQDLERFIETLRGYLEFFTGDLGGRTSTPHEVRDLLSPAPASVRP